MEVFALAWLIPLLPFAAFAVVGTFLQRQHVLASREDLAATLAPVTGPVAETMRQETGRAERIAARLLAEATKAGSMARPVVDRGLGAWRSTVTHRLRRSAAR